MAKEIGVVYVPVVPSGKGFGKAVEGQITDAADSGSKKGSSSILSKIGGAFSTIGKVGVGAIGAVATGIVGLAAKGGFERALNIENAKAKLKGLGHDSTSVTEIMNDALASVKGTAFGLGDAATVAASLSASGVKQGGQLTKVLKTVADTAQISGRSLTDIGTIFGSVAARGKLQGDDMLQLMSSGVPVLQMLGKHLGKTSAEVSTMVSKGKIDFQTFADAMQEGMGGAALSAGATFTGAWANVKAALSRLGEQLATPILDGLRGLFNQAIPLIDGFTATMTPIVQKVGASLQSGLENAIPTISAFFSSLSQSAVITALGKVFDALKSSVGEIAGQFQYFFDEISDNSQVMNAFSGVSDSLASALSDMAGMWDSATTAVTNFILGVADAQGVQNLVSAVSDLAKTAGDVIGSIARASKGIYDFTNTSGLAYDMGQALSGVLNILAGALEFVSNNLDWLGPLASGIGGVVLASKGLGAVSSGLAAIPSALSGITGAANGVIKFITLIPELGGFGAALKSVAGGMGLVKNAQLAWNAVTTMTSTVWRALGAVIAANPIGAIVTAIAAVVAALVWFFTKTKTGQKIWAGFISWLTTAWQKVSGFFQDLWSGIVGVFDSAASGVQGAWNGVTGFFQGIADGITNVWNGVTGFFQDLWSGITGIFQTAVDWIGSFLQSGWGQALLFLINPIAGIVNFIVQHFDTIKTIIKNVLIVVAAIWVTIWNSIVSVFTNVWNGLVAFFTPIITWVQNVITTVVTAVQATWNTVWSAISGFFIGVWNALVAFITPIINTIGSVISSVINGVMNTWNSVWGAVKGFFVSTWNGMVGFVTTIVNTISAIITGVINGIRNTWNSVWGSISGFFTGIWNGMVRSVGGFIANIVSKVRGIKDAIMGPLKGAGDWLYDVGKNVIQGMINGIGGAFKWLKDKITELGNKTLDWAKGVLGIHSPSRVFRSQVGYMVGAGMALGIDDSMKTVRNSVRQMGSLTDQLGFADQASNSSVFAGNGVVAGSSGDGGLSVTQNLYTNDPREAAMAAVRRLNQFV
ncbi:MAG: tape measure protein [Bifidobacterium psychraerophilum]|uniref:tape measure protein n=1 Tax=Bifidobacterium psychraerophilum TaxID=218140 RepID=UPI0039E9C425